MKQRTLFVAIAGKPNTGKSTLTNLLTGTRVSITSPKAQTTVKRLRGIFTEGDTQLVFIDTPGFFKARDKKHREITTEAWDGLKEADLLLFVVDARQSLSGIAPIVAEIKKLGLADVAAVINKCDLVKPPSLLPIAAALDKHGIFSEIFMISAKSGDGVKPLREYMTAKARPMEWPYPEDQAADTSWREMAEEFTREQVFLKTSQEIPYSVEIETESFKESPASITIHQAILVNREAHKKILVGDKAAMIKEIGREARLQMEESFGRRVSLFLFVKVKKKRKDKE